MVSFTHLEPGTAESEWQNDGRLSDAPELDTAVARLVVVAAHPDDETLGAGGLMARVSRDGGAVSVIVATNGEGSHPASTTHSTARLAAMRREEVLGAVRAVAPGAEVHFLALPDSGLREQRDELRIGLAQILGSLPHGSVGVGADATLVAAPWAGDGHRDHRIVAEVVGELCAERGIRHIGYPIWLWHWGDGHAVPWDASEALTLTEAERAAKRSAVAHHRTQVEALSPRPGDEAVLHDGMRAHFDRPREIFLRESSAAASLPARYFDDFYGRHDDPWGFESRWYEKRKREILMASLPLRRLGRTLEVGCATGLVTAELARRAETVTAIDAAHAAIHSARRRVPDDNVRFIIGEVPVDWPTGGFDTIVLSEVGYYLSIADLDRLIDLVEGCAEGCVVACHWRHPVADYPQTGDAVHRALRSMPGWDTTVLHRERDFVLEVFERVPTRSVAEREGLT